MGLRTSIDYAAGNWHWIVRELGVFFAGKLFVELVSLLQMCQVCGLYELLRSEDSNAQVFLLT